MAFHFNTRVKKQPSLSDTSNIIQQQLTKYLSYRGTVWLAGLYKSSSVWNHFWFIENSMYWYIFFLFLFANEEVWNPA